MLNDVASLEEREHRGEALSVSDRQCASHDTGSAASRVASHEDVLKDVESHGDRAERGEASRILDQQSSRCSSHLSDSEY